MKSRQKRGKKQKFKRENIADDPAQKAVELQTRKPGADKSKLMQRSGLPSRAFDRVYDSGVGPGCQQIDAYRNLPIDRYRNRRSGRLESLMGDWKTTGASVGAIFASVLTLGCCLPLPFIGAAGVAGASVFFAGARPWLLGLSVVLLGVGFFQVYRGLRCRTGPSKWAMACLVVSTFTVVVLLLFPQVVAVLFANLLGGRR